MFKKMYSKILKHKFNSIQNLEKIKTLLFELIAIYKKKNLYKDINWTNQQRQEFDDYWLMNYGKKISPKWHKLYQSINGTFNVEYIPEILFSVAMEPKMNDYFFSHYLSDKSIVDVFAKDIAKVPQTLGGCNSGVYYNAEKQIVKKNEFLYSIKNCGEIVIKPTLGGSSGKGVGFLTVKNGVNLEDGNLLSEIIKIYSDNYIIQKRILQCKELESIYSHSVNTIRITTYICDGKVFHMPIALRIGTSNKKIDNIHAGGIGVHVSDDGKLSNLGYQLFYGNLNVKFKVHPDSKVKFSDYIIPNFSRVINAAHTLHNRIPHIRCISWDFSLDENYCPVLIEANLYGQGIWFPQIVSGFGAFGDNTSKILRELRCGDDRF